MTLDEFAISVTASDQPDLLDIPGFCQNGCGTYFVATYKNCILGTIGLIDIGEQIEDVI